MWSGKVESSLITNGFSYVQLGSLVADFSETCDKNLAPSSSSSLVCESPLSATYPHCIHYLPNSHHCCFRYKLDCHGKGPHSAYVLVTLILLNSGPKHKGNGVIETPLLKAFNVSEHLRGNGAQIKVGKPLDEGSSYSEGDSEE